MDSDNVVKFPDTKQREKTKPKRGKPHESFVKIDRWMMDTFAWSRLTPNDRAVFEEALYIYNGANNGYLALPCRALAGRIGISKDSVSRSIQNLMTYGFLRLMQAGSFTLKSRRAAEYCLTHLPCNRTTQPASKEFSRIGKAA